MDQESQVTPTALIYGRVMGLTSTRMLNLENLFQDKLAPIPTSVFSDNGKMCLAMTNVALKRKLQCEHSARACQQQSLEIIYGCAVLWTIDWPSQGTVQTYFEGFLRYIINKFRSSDVYLILQYQSNSRSTGTTENATRQHQLRPETPLRAQNVVLIVTQNKIQMIDVKCQQLAGKVASLQTSGNIRHTSYSCDRS